MPSGALAQVFKERMVNQTMQKLLQISTVLFSCVAAFMPGINSDDDAKNESRPRAGHFTSAPPGLGLVADDGKAEVNKEFKAPGFKPVAESWGDTVDRRLTELERKVALCPCSSTTAAPAATTTTQGGTTIKEAVVRSDMKPQEVVDQLTKLGFKSSTPAVSTVVSSGGSTGAVMGCTGSSYPVVSYPTVTYESSSYASPVYSTQVYSTPVYSGSYSVPAYQPLRPLQNARAYRAATAPSCRIVNGVMQCNN